MPVKHVRSASGFEVKGDMSGFGFPDRRDNAVAGEPYIQTILFADQNPCVFPFPGRCLRIPERGAFRAEFFLLPVTFVCSIPVTE